MVPHHHGQWWMCQMSKASSGVSTKHLLLIPKSALNVPFCSKSSDENDRSYPTASIQLKNPSNAEMNTSTIELTLQHNHNVPKLQHHAEKVYSTTDIIVDWHRDRLDIVLWMASTGDAYFHTPFRHPQSILQTDLLNAELSYRQST